MFKQITEGKVKILIPTEEKVSHKLPVFYNPVMKFNRDITILLLKNLPNKNLRCCDPLAGTGVRSLRLLAELEPDKIDIIIINDMNPKAIENAKECFELNKLDKSKVSFSSEDASVLLLNSKGFDYIDVDPFGSPDPFLDAAVRKIGRDGILAVTATDTSSLAGTYPKVCMRRYWAKPDRGPLKHEIGLRILIRKVQLIAAQYEKALVPIYAYSREHYMRIFFISEKGKLAAVKMLAQHGFFKDAGPMWLGDLVDNDISRKIAEDFKEFDTDDKFTSVVAEEFQIPSVGFFELHDISSREKIECPKVEKVIEEIKKKGFNASRTHFSPYGVRTDMKESDFMQVVKRCSPGTAP